MFRFLQAALRRPAYCPPCSTPTGRSSAATPLMTGVGTAKLPDKLEEKWTFKTGDGKRTGGIEGAAAVVGRSRLRRLARQAPLRHRPRHRQAEVEGEARADEGVAGGQGRPRLRRRPRRQVLLRQRRRRRRCSGRSRPDGEITAGCNFHGDNVLVGSHDSNLYCLEPGRQEGLGDSRPTGRSTAAGGRRRPDLRRRCATASCTSSTRRTARNSARSTSAGRPPRPRRSPATASTSARWPNQVVAVD